MIQIMEISVTFLAVQVLIQHTKTYILNTLAVLGQWFSICCRGPQSLHPKPLRTPSFFQRFSMIEKVDLVPS